MERMALQLEQQVWPKSLPFVARRVDDRAAVEPKCSSSIVISRRRQRTGCAKRHERSRAGRRISAPL